MGIKVATLSQQLSPSELGYVVFSLCVTVYENMCHVALDHGEVQERHKSQESGLSMCPESQESVPCKVESLMASESAGAGTVRAAACRSVCYYTRPHGRIS